MSGDVSVIVPAHDAETYIAEALRSVLAEGPSEVLVIDDGSRDETAAVAAAFGPPVRVIGQANAGPGAAANRGICESRGPILAFCDADDRWAPGRLAGQLRLLDDHATDMVFGLARQFHSPNLTEAERAILPIPSDPVPGIARQGMLIGREDFDRVGPFATGLAAGEFIDWYARAKDAGLREATVEQVVFERRVHRGHLDPSKRAGHADYARVVRGLLERRRLGAG